MKSLPTLLGIILIIFGIAVLGYKGFTYTSREKVAEIGSVEVTADKEKTVYFHPVTGALCLAAGVVLLVVGRRRS